VTALKNSVIIYLLGLCISMPLGFLFSFYIYKKKLLHGLFRVILFLPSIISSIVMIIMYKYCVDRAVPSIIELITKESQLGLLANPDTTWITVVFYGIWTGFATSTMIYSSTMSGISESIVEAATLDGITPLKELRYITFPMVWPTFVTFFVTGFAALLTNTGGLYGFFGDSAEYKLYTFGYYLYVETLKASSAQYCTLSALGILLTAIVAPCTLLLRKFMNKVGPSTV
jgi:ABC-type sugar transport system permease subunit